MLSLSICHQVNYERVELLATKCWLHNSETQADVHLLIHITGSALYIFSVTTNGEIPTFEATSAATYSQQTALYPCVLAIQHSANLKSLFSFYISTLTHTYTHIYIYTYIHTYIHICVVLLYMSCTRAVRKVSSHFEYRENWSRGLDVTSQSVRGYLTVHP